LNAKIKPGGMINCDLASNMTTVENFHVNVKFTFSGVIKPLIITYYSRLSKDIRTILKIKAFHGKKSYTNLRFYQIHEGIEKLNQKYAFTKDSRFSLKTSLGVAIRFVVALQFRGVKRSAHNGEITN